MLILDDPPAARLQLGGEVDVVLGAVAQAREYHNRGPRLGLPNTRGLHSSTCQLNLWDRGCA